MTTKPAHPGVPEPPKGEMYFPTPAYPNRVVKIQDDLTERVLRLLFQGKLIEKVCTKTSPNTTQQNTFQQTGWTSKNRLMSCQRRWCRTGTRHADPHSCGAWPARGGGRREAAFGDGQEGDGEEEGGPEPACADVHGQPVQPVREGPVHCDGHVPELHCAAVRGDVREEGD